MSTNVRKNLKTLKHVSFVNRTISNLSHYNPWWCHRVLDLSRFDAAPLIAFTATKETYYGTETDGRIPQGCGAYCADQWADAQIGC